MAFEAGQRVGDYEIEALLGSGGMSCVYKVRNIFSDREDAMKVLLPDLVSEPELATRFMVEIRTLAGLEHPNIAHLHTAFQFQNQLVMVMELVEGATLERLASASKIPVDPALEYFMQVLSALSYAHAKGVTHRDIKPSNIMITSHGLVKLMDFGIAKSANDLQLTRPGTTMGSIYYMSPEQVRGGAVDARSDIYSLGVTLYEVLTGRKPFQAETSYGVLNAQLNEAPTPLVQLNPDLPLQLSDLVLRAMVKQPDGRFQTAEEFRNALMALRAPQPEPQLAAPSASQPLVPVPAAAPPTPKSHRGLWIGIGTAAAIFALIAAATVLPRVLSTHASQQAARMAAGSQPVAAATPSPLAQPAAPASPPSRPAYHAAQSAGNAGAPHTPPAQAESPAPDPARPKVSAVTAAQPNSLGAAATAAPPPPAATSQPAAPASPPSRPADQGANSVGNAGTPYTPPAQAESPAPVPPMAHPPPSPEEIQRGQLRRWTDLNARANAVRGGINNRRRLRQAQGSDVLPGVLATLNRMNGLLIQARQDIAQNHPRAAKISMDNANGALTRLELFLSQ